MAQLWVFWSVHDPLPNIKFQTDDFQGWSESEEIAIHILLEEGITVQWCGILFLKGNLAYMLKRLAKQIFEFHF